MSIASISPSPSPSIALSISNFRFSTEKKTTRPFFSSDCTCNGHCYVSFKFSATKKTVAKMCSKNYTFLQQFFLSLLSILMLLYELIVQSEMAQKWLVSLAIEEKYSIVPNVYEIFNAHWNTNRCTTRLEIQCLLND